METIFFIVLCFKKFSVALDCLPMLISFWFTFLVIDELDKDIDILMTSSGDNKLCHNKYNKDIEDLKKQNKKLEQELKQIKEQLKND